MAKSKKSTNKLTDTILKYYTPIAVVLIIGIVGSFYLSFSGALATTITRNTLSGKLEYEQVVAVNKSRTAAGKKTVKHIECLNTLAEKWSKNMAAKNTLYHNANVGGGSSTTWSITYHCGAGRYYYGEVVSYVYNPSTIHSVFMNSAPHKAIILDSKWNRIGVGVYVDGSGKIWTTEVFTSCGSSCSTTKWSTGATYPST